MTVSYGAPGRVNLIGEHTDYNLGFALPIALPRRTVVTFTPEHTGAITARSDRADGSAQEVSPSRMNRQTCTHRRSPCRAPGAQGQPATPTSTGERR